MNTVCERSWVGIFSSGDSSPLTSSDSLAVRGLQSLKRIGGDDGTRTRGLCRDRATTTCNLLDFNGTDSPFLIL